MNIEVAPNETEIQADWYSAVIYCQFLEVDSETGWRLPTKDELNDIYKSKNDFIGYYYWSATDDTIDCAWGQGFLTGLQYNYFKYNSAYVRAVRDIK